MYKKLLATLMITSVLGGCANQSFTINGENTDALPAKQQAQTFFIDGIGQSKQLDAASICGGADKVVKVATEQTFVNGLMAVASFGIYTPRNAYVYCKAS